MKLIIDKEVLNDSIAESMMSVTAYDIVNEYDLCVILDHYDGVYNVTIHEFVNEDNPEPAFEWNEFEDDYPAEYAISDVLYDLMPKIWGEK